jgi:hypothetical protein
MDTKQTNRQTTQEDKEGEEEMTNKFMFFENFKDTADKLPDDLRLKFYDAMTDYVFKGVEPDDVVISALITAIKPSLDKEDGRKNNGGNHNPTGKNQFLKEKEIEQNQKQLKHLRSIPVNCGQIGQFRSIPLETETETENNTPLISSPQGENTQIDLEEAIAKTKRFTKPTIDEIETYCQEKGKSVDAERFWNFYESKGWKVGKSPMKDWRAAVCNWAKDSKPTPVVQEDYVPRVDAEKVKQMASIAELTKQRMMENAQRKYGA